jgi:hypothetical protein
MKAEIIEFPSDPEEFLLWLLSETEQRRKSTEDLLPVIDLISQCTHAFLFNHFQTEHDLKELH